MFENYLLISVLITAAWIGLIVAYIFISGRQKSLEEELNQLQERFSATHSQTGEDR